MRQGPGNLLCMCVVLFAAGCAVPERAVEKDERARIAAVETNYPPEKSESVLPQFSAASGPGEYVRFALVNNPGVRAAFYEWKSAVEAVAVARYLPDPQLTFEAELNRIDDLLMAGVMLMAPPASIALQAEAYSLEARTKRFAFQQAMLQTSFDVKKTLYELCALRGEIEQTERIVELQGQIQELLRMKQRVDLASEIDVLEAVREQESFTTRLDDLRDYERFLHTRLGAALGLDNREELTVPDGLPFTDTISTEDDLWTLVRQNNPALAQRRDLVSQSDVYVQAAYREYVPGFTIGFERSFFADMSMKKPKLNLTIPLPGRVRARIAQSLSDREQARSALRSEELNQIVLLSEALFRWRRADREEQLLRLTMIPSLRVSIELTGTEYRNGSAALDDILLQQVKLCQYTAGHLAAQAARETALCEVMLVISGVMPEEEQPFTGGFDSE